METIFVLLPLALVIATIAVGLFIWAARTGQFDDLDTPAIRILYDHDEPRAHHPARVASGGPAAPAGAPPSAAPSSPSVGSTRRLPE